VGVPAPHLALRLMNQHGIGEGALDLRQNVVEIPMQLTAARHPVGRSERNEGGDEDHPRTCHKQYKRDHLPAPWSEPRPHLVPTFDPRPTSIRQEYDRAVAASEDTPATAERKAALRAEMRRVRAELTPGERDRLSRDVGDRLFELPVLGTPRTVMVFASFGSEVPTEDIIRRLAGEGHAVLLPVVDDEELGAVRYRPGEPLTETSYGPREPANRITVGPEEIDVVITPGLAFDRTGARLGYGGAYYDRFLPLLGRRTVTIGVGFHRQLVNEVPAGPDDVRVDVVVTDLEVVHCRFAVKLAPDD
jgi:5-formyltetrahydrofolate cyclo-ligase